MKYALCLQPYIPMRSEASERSEMVSQLLFGDTFRITDEVPHWFFIERDCDGYTGWIDWKTAVILSELDYLRYVNESASAPLLRLPYNQAQKKARGLSAPSLFLSFFTAFFIRPLFLTKKVKNIFLFKV